MFEAWDMGTCLTTNNTNFSMIKQCSGQQELFLDQHLMTERTNTLYGSALGYEDEIMTPIFFVGQRSSRI
jgi:hypothetical protein